jgi:O-antigen ligase
MTLIGWLIVLICLLSPWQIYLISGPFGSLSLVQMSLVPLLVLLAARALLRPTRGLLPAHGPFLLLAAFSALCLVGAFWSPDQALAIKTFIKVAGILVVCVAVAVSPQHVRRAAIATLSASAAVLAIAVVVFRVLPLLEAGFLYSPFATYTVDPDILTGLVEGTEWANVLAGDRAGGVFSNANVASLFFGLCLFLTLAARLGPRRTTALSAPLVAGILATGSKAGLAALVVTGVVWLMVWMRGRLTLGGVSLLSAGGMVALFGFVFYIVRARLWETSAQSFDTRFEVWRLAITQLGQHPVLGLGFGGWERWIDDALAYEGTFVRYPLHNLFLIAWSWVGFGGAVLAAAFALTAIVSPLRRPTIVAARDHLARRALSLTFLWFLIQSMFTNAAVTDIRIGVPLGVALGLLTLARDETTDTVLTSATRT